MMNQKSDRLKYTVDRMTVRNGRIFGFGWIFHHDSEIKSIQLDLKLSDGGLVTLPIIYNKLREDVYKEFPDVPQSLRCGFVVYGGWNAGAGIADASIVGSLQEGGGFKVGAPITNLPVSSKLSLIRFLPYRVMLVRAWHLLSTGKFSALRSKIKRYWPTVPASNEDIRRASRELLSTESCARVMLVVDHDLGGGANTYRQDLLKDYLQRGYGVLMLTYNLLSWH